MEPTESKIRALIGRAATAYSAGPSVSDTRRVCQDLAQAGVASTICYWNVGTEEPLRMSAVYSQLLGVIWQLQTDCYLSIKAPAINLDPRLLQKILARAWRTGVKVHFDAMGPEAADATFALIDMARHVYPRLGCTLPGRWRRSLADADRAIALDLEVRVVKGQWSEGTTEEIDPRNGFLDVIDRLATGRARHVAVATHDVELARQAVRRLKTSGIDCELELLYGLPARPVLALAQQLKVPARMYVPCGRVGLPYRLHQAVRNPRILAWFAHDLWRAGKPLNSVGSAKRRLAA
jgi:proline dehydrogenase